MLRFRFLLLYLLFLVVPNGLSNLLPLATDLRALAPNSIARRLRPAELASAVGVFSQSLVLEAETPRLGAFHQRQQSGFSILPIASVKAARVDCSVVISAISRHLSRGGLDRALDISGIAEKLGTSVAWAEHCARIYGRRVGRPGLQSSEGREEKLEALEDFEPEEPSEPEDRGERAVRRDHSKQPKLDGDGKDDKKLPNGASGGS